MCRQFGVTNAVQQVMLMTHYANQGEAWLEVVHGIRRALEA